MDSANDTAMAILVNLGMKPKEAERRIKQHNHIADIGELVKVCLTGQNLTIERPPVPVDHRYRSLAEPIPALEAVRECAKRYPGPAIERNPDMWPASAKSSNTVVIRPKHARQWATIILELDAIGVGPDIVRSAFAHYLKGNERM